MPSRVYPMMLSVKSCEWRERGDLLRHLRLRGCYLKHEGAQRSVWTNPNTGAQEAVPRHGEIGNNLAKRICKGLGIPPPSCS